MSNYDSIYSQKSMDYYDLGEGEDYVVDCPDYPIMRSSMPSYNDRRDEHIENHVINRHTYHTSNNNNSFDHDSLYPPLPNQRYQYSTSQNSNSYEYNQNELSSFPQNWKPSSSYKPPSSPRLSPVQYSNTPMKSPRMSPQEPYNNNNASQGNLNILPEFYLLHPSPRSASLRNFNRVYESSPRQHTSLPVNMTQNDPNIRPYPPADISRSPRLNNDNFYHRKEPDQGFSEGNDDIIDSYYSDLDNKPGSTQEGNY